MISCSQFLFFTHWQRWLWVLSLNMWLRETQRGPLRYLQEKHQQVPQRLKISGLEKKRDHNKPILKSSSVCKKHMENSRRILPPKQQDIQQQQGENWQQTASIKRPEECAYILTPHTHTHTKHLFLHSSFNTTRRLCSRKVRSFFVHLCAT